MKISENTAIKIPIKELKRKIQYRLELMPIQLKFDNWDLIIINCKEILNLIEENKEKL